MKFCMFLMTHRQQTCVNKREREKEGEKREREKRERKERVGQ